MKVTVRGVESPSNAYLKSIDSPAPTSFYLRGFATFLCGTFAGSGLRTFLNDQFEQSLLNDGYQMVGNMLVETGIDTSVPSELTALPDTSFAPSSS
ncbi:MAG: hypothetical protein WCF26_18055 [Candidatus Sulfotelmatobacter sp.]